MPKKHVELQIAGGRVVLLDAEDLSLVSRYKWHPLRRGHTWYAKHTLRVSEDPQGGSILMHRLIVGITDSRQVDHQSGDGLDNSRANLRICSREENHRNSRRRADNATGYKGVSFIPRLDRFYARIFINKKTVYLGSFTTPEEAHAAYCHAASEFYGEFARTA